MASGYVKGEPHVTLRLEAYLGAPESYDSVLIEGSPRIYSKIAGGVHGDIATASITVNSIPAVLTAPPGLRTMRDMRLPSFFSGGRCPASAGRLTIRRASTRLRTAAGSKNRGSEKSACAALSAIRR